MASRRDLRRQRVGAADGRRRHVRRRRSPSTPGCCTLSILFSDWDRSGQRDLRMTNDRHYYRDGEEQLWRVAPGEPPRLYTDADGWQPLQIWGMGIASQDLTGDGLPEVFLTSQGDNKLQTLADGAGPAALPRHRARSGRDRTAAVRRRRRAAVHGLARRVRRTSTTTASSTSSSPRATSRRMPDFATKDPSNLLIGQRRRHVRRGRRGGRHRHFDRAPRRRRWSTSTSTGCSISSR